MFNDAMQDVCGSNAGTAKMPSETAEGRILTQPRLKVLRFELENGTSICSGYLGLMHVVNNETDSSATIPTNG